MTTAKLPARADVVIIGGGIVGCSIAYHLTKIGITNVVPTASARADQLTRAEMRAGAVELEAKVARLRPSVVAVLGLTVYRQAFDRPKAKQGEQPEQLAGARLFVLPNPSGLNAHESVASRATAYREAWLACV